MGRFDALTQLDENPQPAQTLDSEPVVADKRHIPAPQSAKPVKQDTSPVPHAETAKRPVKPRHGFDIYWDQYEALVKWSNEEKLQGGTGSMSRMVREALDDYIAKRKKQ